MMVSNFIKNSIDYQKQNKRTCTETYVVRIGYTLGWDRLELFVEINVRGLPLVLAIHL